MKDPKVVSLKQCTLEHRRRGPWMLHYRETSGLAWLQGRARGGGLTTHRMTVSGGKLLVSITGVTWRAE